MNTTSMEAKDVGVRLEALATFDALASLEKFLAEGPVTTPEAPADSILFPVHGWELAPTALACLPPGLLQAIENAKAIGRPAVRVGIDGRATPSWGPVKPFEWRKAEMIRERAAAWHAENAGRNDEPVDAPAPEPDIDDVAPEAQDREAFIPSLACIERACREIRSTWSEREHRERAGMPERYRVPSCKRGATNSVGRMAEAM